MRIVASLLATFAVLAAGANAQQLRLIPTLTLSGGADGFGPVSWIAVSATGRIAVWESQENRALIHDPSGKLLGTLGKAGDGPGEFRGAMTGGWVGDTLWVADPRARRTTLFAPDLKLLRTEPFPNQLRDPSPVATLGMLAPRARYADGSSLVHVQQAAGGRQLGNAPPTPNRYPYVRTTRDGVVQHIVAWRSPAAECWAGETPIPFCADERHAISPDGAYLAFVRQENVDRRAAAFRLVVMSASGDTLLSRAYPYRPASVSTRVADSARDARVRATPQPELAAEARRMVVPSVYPPVRGVIIGNDRSIWLEREVPGTWQLLDQRGNVRGTVAVPRNVTLRAVSAATAWGIALDDDDLPTVVGFRVVQGQ